ncbi:MAG: thioredoxin [Candidatus Aquicultorales bacterium]
MGLKEIADQNFDEAVLKSEKPVLVDFWAPWCGPCRMLAPRIEEISKDFEDKIEVVKLNVDENPVNASRFEVLSIPTMILFKGGKPAERVVGALPKDDIVRRLKLDELTA